MSLKNRRHGHEALLLIRGNISLGCIAALAQGGDSWDSACALNRRRLLYVMVKTNLLEVSL